MTDEPSFTIAGENGRVSVRVLAYEHLHVADLSDANWLTCEAAIVVPPFRAEFRAAFSTHDFARFESALRELSSKLAGEAVFDGDEETLRLKVSMGARGTLRLEGRAQCEGAGLDFELRGDQSYLSDALRGLKEVTGRFPPRT